MIEMTYKLARRVTIFVVGATVVTIGIVMLVTPGPAFIVIPAGLAILSVEFAWARHWLQKLRQSISLRNRDKRGVGAERHRQRVEVR